MLSLWYFCNLFGSVMRCIYKRTLYKNHKCVRCSMKKRSVLILVMAIVILGYVAIVLIVHENHRQRCNKDQWKSIKEISDIADFFDAPITEMTLREGVTSAEWAVFSDDDLIADWNFFFDNTEVKCEGRASKDSDACGMVVTAINADGDTLVFVAYYDSSGACKIDIGGTAFITKESPGLPFKSTYWRAIERHGITTPWD